MSDAAGSSIVDEVLTKVKDGPVPMTPAKAIQLAGQLYLEGKFAQAGNVCRKIIARAPDNADAHNILGVSLSAEGKTKEALAALRRAVKLAPRISSFHANLGEIERQRGDLGEARIALRRAVELDPRNAQAYNNLGITHYEKSEYRDAIDCYRKAIDINPQFAEAYNNLGNALRASGEREEALKAYQDALTWREVYPEAYNNLGTTLREDEKLPEAEHAYRKAITQNPRYVEAHTNLAALLMAADLEVEALRILTEVFKIEPRNPVGLIQTARIQLRRHNLPAAEQACRMAIEDDARNFEAYTLLGHIMHETDRFDEAIAALEAALKINPDFTEARNFYGVALKSVGRLDEARENILKALSQNDRLLGAYANLNDLIDYRNEDELFGRMEAIFAEAPDKEADHLLPLHYGFAKALDDRGQSARALEHYIVGGRMKRAKLNYVEEEIFAFFDNIRNAFPADIFTNRPYAGNPSPRPVFIVGMPRSGSTLVEQILSSHPDVFGAGEVKYLSRALNQLRDRFPSLPRYPEMVGRLSGAQFGIAADHYLKDLTATAGKAARVTDKLLTNYFFVGLIHLLFPNAKIINTRRDPVDTCLSAFTKLFKDDMPHSYDFGELGRYYRQYEALMDHWNAVLPAGVMRTVVYEDVVGDTEKEARALIDFLGLPWNDACLAFHKSDRPVKTASVAQVRKPIYTSAVQRWRKYGPGLQPLLDALGIDEIIEGAAPKPVRKRRAKAPAA